MEIKKSKGADLESKKTTGFLLGLIFVLSAFFVALEFTEGGLQMDFNSDMLSELPKHEEDLIPLVTRKELTAEARKELAKTADNLTVADDEPEVMPADEAGTEDNVAEEEQPEAQETPDTQPAEEEKEEPKQIANADDNPLNFRIVENLPEFPGGASEFVQWLTKNLQYPKAVQLRKVQGKVVAQFVVNTDGTVSDLKIVTHLDTACDREVMRVLGMMPAWKPGLQDGKPCRTLVAIPIVFKL